MKKNFIFLILLVFPFKALSHTDHYKNINKIEMEILKDGKVIGYCNYEFFHKDKSLEVQNNTKFEVKIFGVKVLKKRNYKSHQLSRQNWFIRNICTLYFSRKTTKLVY